MRKMYLILVLFICMKSLSQDSVIEVVNRYDKGVLVQQGFYKNAKPHGVWVIYGATGEKIATGSYANGVKIGIWCFWKDKKLTQIDFSSTKESFRTAVPYKTQLVSY